MADPYSALGVSPSSGQSRSAAGASTAAASNDGAYWGKNKNYRSQAVAAGTGVPIGPGGLPSPWRLGNARGEAMLADPKKRQRIYNALLEAGVITDRTALGSGGVDTAWRKAMDYSAQLFTEGKRITPWKLLEAMAANGGAGGAGTSGYGSSAPFSGTKTQTSTSSDANLTGRAQAGDLLDSAFAGELGREARNPEEKSFTKDLNRKERANPRVTTTQASATYRAGDMVSSNSTSTSKGGYEGGDGLARDTAREDDDYAEYQAATTYFDALMNLVRG